MAETPIGLPDYLRAVAEREAAMTAQADELRCSIAELNALVTQWRNRAIEHGYTDEYVGRASLPAPTDAEWMKEAERLEVVSAWNDLPDALKAHPGLKRLYRALGGVAAHPAEPTPSVDAERLDWLLPNLHPANFGLEFPGGYEWDDEAEFLQKWRSAIDAARQALEKP